MNYDEFNIPDFITWLIAKLGQMHFLIIFLLSSNAYVEYHT